MVENTKSWSNGPIHGIFHQISLSKSMHIALSLSQLTYPLPVCPTHCGAQRRTYIMSKVKLNFVDLQRQGFGKVEKFYLYCCRSASLLQNREKRGNSYRDQSRRGRSASGQPEHQESLKQISPGTKYRCTLVLSGGAIFIIPYSQIVVNPPILWPVSMQILECVTPLTLSLFSRPNCQPRKPRIDDLANIFGPSRLFWFTRPFLYPGD